jgi:GAF domain-containing protein/ANTAR domain-containing protein
MVDLTGLRRAVAAAMVANPVGADNVESSSTAVCRVCAKALPADGAAFTAMASDQARELWYASDPMIARVHELQFGLGEGPTLDAFHAGRPVFVPDFADVAADRWPILTPALAASEIGGLFTFPIGLGAITIGVLAAYRTAPGQLTSEHLATVLGIADLAAAALLALRAGHPNGRTNSQPDMPDDGYVGEIWLDGVGADQRVHQATGMLIAQLGVSAEEAFARLRGHAFATDQRIGAVAEQIVAGGLILNQEPD